MKSERLKEFAGALQTFCEQRSITDIREVLQQAFDQASSSTNNFREYAATLREFANFLEQHAGPADHLEKWPEDVRLKPFSASKAEGGVAAPQGVYEDVLQNVDPPNQI